MYVIKVSMCINSINRNSE